MEACCCSSSSAPPASILATGAGLRRRFSPAAVAAAASGGRAVALALAPPLRASSAALLAAPPRRGQQRRGAAGLVVRAVFERFTERAVKAVVLSQREARGMGDEVVAPHHLLLGLVAEDRSAAGFLASGVRIERAREACRAAVGKGGLAQAATGLATDVPFSGASKRVFVAAVEFSRNMGCNFISPDHIALGLFDLDDPTTNSILKSLGVVPTQLAKQALTRVKGELAKDGREPLGLSSFKLRDKSAAGNGRTAIAKYSNKKKEKSALAQFCIDLTMRASGGFIDPVIGRTKEIERVVQIICRRTKNNPILLGEAGVGKTAIAEGLALKIANGDVPIFLVGKRILSLDVALLMAGAKERGELEARVTSLIREVRKADDVILFIDEVHTLIGSGIAGRGNKGAGLDIANLLKPALARGELQCIASTTLDEHRLHFEKDKALARRFQPVYVNEPSQEDAVKILLGLREKYETYHKCKYTLEGINAAVYLSVRYIPDRHLPDKAIDLIDEAGSRARMESFKKKKEEQCSIILKSPDEYWQEIRAVQAMHEVALTNRLKYSLNENDQENEVNVEVLDDSKTSPTTTPSASADEPSVVGLEEIARVTSLWSGIPVQQLTADERKLLVGLDDELRKRVIGQDDAVVAISRAVKRSRTGMSDPDRPIATLLFCGPTGVGKTELTKALASTYFGSESAMVRLDMSEYMERHAVSKLIGAPPGYMGFGEGGTLTEAVRRKPFTVVLFDEIEKAHPDIFNILLQVFEDGHLTDSQGRRVSFKNTLIVMTSNVGSTSISKGTMSMGFQTQNDTEENTYAVMKSLVMEELKAFFRPELLNRMDEVVVFHPLEKTQMLAILNIILEEVKGRLLALGIGLVVSDAMKNMISQQGYDKSYGARPLRRAVTQLVEDVISEAILSGQYKPGDTIMMDTDDKGKPCLSRLNNQTVQVSDPTPTL
ncbi:chaperone protein ClpD2, chloroplastic [Triticum urartu]|uniref:Clp R domain-containing protein n=1 Tax=Triticum urartu TaxID=4572 RepID=A0A8R7THU7_TRIUA|nr:chaperone protein ClpD2, chloroplastic [Triticum urartu]XP_048557260.1 chaperone protein ClpD2, chloroplastic [Triticum urartu]